MYVSADDATWYGIDLAPEAERNPTTWFGAVRRGKRYVSIYLMPVYVRPGRLDSTATRPSCASGCRASRASDFNKVASR